MFMDVLENSKNPGYFTMDDFQESIKSKEEKLETLQRMQQATGGVVTDQRPNALQRIWKRTFNFNS